MFLLNITIVLIGLHFTLIVENSVSQLRCAVVKCKKQIEL